MANEFIARNGIISRNNLTVTGSTILSGSNSVTGSLKILGGSDFYLFDFKTPTGQSLIRGSTNGGMEISADVTYFNKTTNILSTFLIGSHFNIRSGNDINALWIRDNGNIVSGINTDPGYRLYISGSGNFTGNLTVTGSTILYGNVGINTTNPLTKFQVSGTAIISNPAGNGYNENLRLPQANSGYAALCIGGAIAASGTTTEQWTFVKYPTSNDFSLRNSNTDYFYFTQGGLLGIGTQSPSAKLTVKGSGTTSATTSLLVQNSSANPALTVRDDGKVSIGNTSAYADSTAGLYVGTVAAGDNNAKLIVDPYNADTTYYKLVLESRYYGEQPFQLYSSNVQTWLYGYGNPMFAQPPAMKIPNQISMGTTDIGKSEISGSVLFIHGQDFYAQRSYIRMTSYTTGVDTLRGSTLGLWTGDRLRLWNYENTSVDLGVNNVQRLQVTPSGINVTGSIVATGNLTLGTDGRIASGDFAVAGNNSIATGYSTEARGNGSIVAGFISNTDSGADFNAAIGYEARSYLPGQISFAYGNHTFNNRDAGAQQSFITVKNSSGLTTGATMDLSIAGTNITLLGTNRAWMVTMDWISTVSSISGTATGVTVGDTAGGTIRAVVKKVGGVLSVVGIIANDKAADTSLSAVAMTFVAGGSANLIPRFTGPTFAGGGTVTMKVVGGIKLSETSI